MSNVNNGAGCDNPEDPAPKPSKYRSQLFIHDGFIIACKRKRPNIWWRFWQSFFFGFKWVNCGPKKPTLKTKA